VDLLTKGSSHYEANEAEIAENTQVLREVLESFRIGVKEISCSCGPTITRFEVKPDAGVRVRSIANLVDDIALGMAKAGVRIEAPIPGKAAVGIEVPNAEPATVFFRNVLETPEFRNHKSRIAACLGADVSGRPVILDINKMPHLLVAGTTGSGKSVCINSIIMSILYKAKPDEVKLILIDPKKVEFAVYRDLPHLYCPIISDPKKAAGALNSAVNEMERRFELIEEVGVRNIAGYNEVTADDPARPYMPQMVIIIDELADLMMTASNEVETAICRLAQKARAAGMHLILGTQRPSTDVITGLIKANVPSRIAFTVTQSIDSRIIIDTVGAEKLIGRGDMLYSPVGTTKPLRVQGTFVSDGEVERVVSFLRDNNERVEFDESFTRQIEIEAAKCAASGKKKGGDAVDIDEYGGSLSGSSGGGSFGGAPAGRKDNEDPKFWEALEVAAGKDKIGTSALQRALNLGYGRAAKIIDRMEELGLVSAAEGNKPRKLLPAAQGYLDHMGAGGDGDPSDDFEDDYS
jgi:S-DNA-T family DNA segregation ATPase FtsK/SpoIIIE